MKSLKQSHKLTHWFYDTLFFSKTKESLGGHVRLLLTGSAPISQKTLDFLRISFQCPVVEGYGQTEGCAL